VLKLQTPAKINLTLEVLGQRPDGYHELRSVFQTVGMYDTLYFEASRKVNITGNTEDWIPGESLVMRTVELIKKRARVRKGADIRVEKTIPLLSGLGGDSSDAAATVLGLNQLWGLDWEKEKLADVAAELGSDVTFFLTGGTALAEGRGEKITNLPALPRRWVVLMLPDIVAEKGKTSQMYQALRASHFTDGQTTRRLVEVLITGLSFRPTMLVNNFENVAFAKGSILKTYKEHILKLGATFVHLCGSGPALYTMYAEKTTADDLAVRCMNQGLRSHVVSTL